MDGGRYVPHASSCYMYYRFNGAANAVDVCGGNEAGKPGGTMTNSGNANVASNGKMGFGYHLDGNGDYGTVDFGTGGDAITMAADWSIEAWVKPSTNGQGTIFSISNSDDDEDDDELSIHLSATNEVSVCSGGEDCATTSGVDMADDTWYHIAVTHHFISIFSDNVDIYVNNKRVVENNGFPDFRGTPSGSLVVEIGTGDDDDGGDFDGVIDEVRMVNYQRMAFGGGIMLKQVTPGDDKVTIYNAAGSSIDLTGIKLMYDDDDSQCFTFSGSLSAGSSQEVTCSHNLGSDDGVYLVDLDGDNSGSSDAGADGVGKEWTIDGVCWRSDGSGSAAACNDSDDPAVAAGIWTEDTYVAYETGKDGVMLKSDGDNDEAVSDWRDIPEFPTLLLPIASMLMIIRYNYRKKNLIES